MRRYKKMPIWDYVSRAIGYFIVSAIAISIGIVNEQARPVYGKIWIVFGVILAVFGIILLIQKILNDHPMN